MLMDTTVDLQLLDQLNIRNGAVRLDPDSKLI